MPSKNRIFISPTPEFRQALEAYQAEHGLSSLSATVLELAAKGMKYKNAARNSWGGKRHIDKIVQAADELSDFGRNDPTE